MGYLPKKSKTAGGATWEVGSHTFYLFILSLFMNEIRLLKRFYPIDLLGELHDFIKSSMMIQFVDRYIRNTFMGFYSYPYSYPKRKSSYYLPNNKRITSKFCCLTRIRTSTDRTKNCSATITP